MTHRLECGADDCESGCPCWCHARCGASMPQAEGPCYRLAGHRNDHRSRYAIENDRRRKVV